MDDLHCQVMADLTEMVDMSQCPQWRKTISIWLY